MAYMIDRDLDDEINTAFSIDGKNEETEGESTRKLFKNHKKLMIKFLNHKLDISSLKSYISHNIIPRGLRERIVPAEHLYTPRFLEAWKEECLNRGLALMKIIVLEEETQLEEIKGELEISAKALEPHKNEPDFEKNNEFNKKEIERIQKNLKHTKQEKFRQNIIDFEGGDIFNPTLPNRSRSSSRNSRHLQCTSRNRIGSSSDSDLDKETPIKSVTF